MFDEYRRALTAQRFRAEDVDLGRLDYHVPLLERLDAVEGSSVVLYDLYQRRYVFLTPSFKFLLGYRREEALDQGPEFFYRRMHPEDLPVVLDTVTRTLRFLYGLPPGQRKDYKLGFDFRIRRPDDRLIRLLQQVVVLELDARGNIWLVLAVNDLVQGGTLEAPAGRSLRNLRSGKEYLFARGGRALRGGGRAAAPRPDQTGDRGARAGGGGHGQPADRRPPVHQRGHREQPSPAHLIEDARQELQRSRALRLAAGHPVAGRRNRT